MGLFAGWRLRTQKKARRHDRRQNSSGRHQQQGLTALIRRFRGGAHSSGRYPICRDRLGDVLQCLRANLIVADIQLAADLVPGIARDDNPTWIGQRLQPRGDIDAVAKYVAILGDDIAQIDADAEYDSTVRGFPGVRRRHRLLQRHGAAHRIHHAGEFRQYAVAHQFDDAAMVIRDNGVYDFGQTSLQTDKRSLFVGRHQPAVPDDVGGQDCPQLTLHDSLPWAGRRFLCGQ